MARRRRSHVLVIVTITALLAGILAIALGRPWSSSTSRVEPKHAFSHQPGGQPGEEDSLRFGFTLDNVTDVRGITTYLQSLPRRPVVRIVFDHGRRASSYARAVQAIAPHADIMGQILDSSAMAKTSTADYLARTREYLNAFADQVLVWEVGNEVNGEWLGDPKQVRDKVIGAQRLLADAGEQTALTVFYNPNCWWKPEHEVFRWVEENLPATVREQIDYALLSYYESDCKNYRPDSWDPVFDRLAELFPNSLLAFGEVGLTKPVRADTRDQAQRLMRYYYSVRPEMDRFVGGWFWWYARQDLVERPSLLRSTFHDILAQG